MTTPREKYERRRQTLHELIENGVVDEETGAAIQELCDAYDDQDATTAIPADEKSRTPGTLMSWVYRLMAFAKERDLTVASINQLNSDIQAMHDGEHPAVKDAGVQKSTLRSYQAALRKFYQYHDYGVDPGEIPMYSQAKSPIDPNDMLTREEIQQAREAVEHPRDRSIFDLLLYTGQRREAIRTLRLKDVDIDDGTYRLNPNVDGLKGAQDRNGSRPLLGAKGTLQNWLEYHPDTSNSEHYLITARPSYSVVNPSEPVTGETIRRVMQEIKSKTSIQKPMHPHAMRHNFVTIAKRDYGLPDDTIKYLIGHDAASNVMETTYSHLASDDHVKRAEEAWGVREPDGKSPLTPEVCPTCGNELKPNAKACERCGSVFTPDANAVQDDLKEEIWKDKVEAKRLEELRSLLDDHPELIEEIIDNS